MRSSIVTRLENVCFLVSNSWTLAIFRIFLSLQLLGNTANAQRVFHGTAQVIDDVNLPGLSFDDRTEHTYSYASGGIGTFADASITRKFSKPIKSIVLTIEAGHADDVGYVGGKVVTQDQSGCFGGGNVTAPVEVTSEVIVAENTATFTLRGKETCCSCVGGWGQDNLPGTANARFHWVVTLEDKLPDLVGSIFEYRVPKDSRNIANGPLPVNYDFIISSTIENHGSADAGRFEVAFYLSTDNKINQTEDFFIGKVSVPSLGYKPMFNVRTIRETFNLGNSLPQTYFGSVFLGAILDVNNSITESEEQNNASQAEGSDFKTVVLYDPIAPRKIVSFKNYSEARMFIAKNRFLPSPHHRIDLGYSRELTIPVWSRFNGKVMPAGYFRMQAEFSRKNLPGMPPSIVIQGGEPSFNPGQFLLPFGEPNPRMPFNLDLSWQNYVYEYHGRF